MNAIAKLTEYEVVDHGIDHCQYFQGCGIYFSPYNHVVTGCGNDAKEAIEDALELLAMYDLDLDGADDTILADWPHAYGTETVPDDAEDTYYYVSIRYNVE